MRDLSILILLYIFVICSNTFAQNADSTDENYFLGKQAAFRTLAADSLAILLCGEVTTPVGFKRLEICIKEYNIDIRILQFSPFPDHNNIMYAKGFNDVMKEAIRERFGEDFFEQLDQKAKLLDQKELEDELTAEFDKQWSNQEDSTGIRVLGLKSSYPLPSNEDIVPDNPIYIKVRVEDVVWDGQKKGRAVQVSLPYEYRRYDEVNFFSSSLVAYALSIAAILEYEPIKGRDKYRSTIIVPILFK